MPSPAAPRPEPRLVPPRFAPRRRRRVPEGLGERLLLALIAATLVAALVLLARELGVTAVTVTVARRGAAPVALTASRATPTATATALPGPEPAVDEAALRAVAERWAAHWTAGNYDALYELVAAPGPEELAHDRFVARYRAIAGEAGITGVRATVGARRPGGTTFALDVETQSSLVGVIREELALPLVQRPDGSWGVAWTTGLIFRELGDGTVRYRPDVPARGRILDRRGRVLAEQGAVLRVGAVPGRVDDGGAALAAALGLPPAEVAAQLAAAQPDWFVPLATLTGPPDAAREAALAALPGATLRREVGRVYPQGTVAAHAVGYLGDATAEELGAGLAARGYALGDPVGRAGAEQWAEGLLAGRRGGTLAILGPDGAARAQLAARPSVPAADVTLTLDLDVQRAVEAGLGQGPGAAVALDPATGAILALASSPSFDPNALTHGAGPAERARLADPALRPAWDRATQGEYPPGPLFAPVVAAAALTYLGATPETSYDCPATFALPGRPTVWRDRSAPAARGKLPLAGALAQSCATAVAALGATLDEHGGLLLPSTARGFGLGAPTGLAELAEASGLVPDATWKGAVLPTPWSPEDAVDLALGRGFARATPLQLAVVTAALANGGTRLAPYLVARAEDPGGGARRYEAARRETGRLPLPPAALAVLQAGFRDGVAAPAGAARAVFAGAAPAAGLAGVAQAPPGEEDSWLAGYAPLEGPRIAVVGVIEGTGPTGQPAAAIGRRAVDVVLATAPDPASAPSGAPGPATPTPSGAPGPAAPTPPGTPSPAAPGAPVPALPTPSGAPGAAPGSATTPDPATPAPSAAPDPATPTAPGATPAPVTGPTPVAPAAPPAPGGTATPRGAAPYGSSSA